MINIGLVGATGRMGRMIINSIINNPDTKLTAALERFKHPLIDKNIGDIIGVSDLQVKLTDDIKKFVDDCEIIIDFSAADATLNLIKNINNPDKKIVIGTTGLTEEQKKIVAEFSKTNAVVYSPNMSIGVNLLFKLVAEAAKVIGKKYDIEIVEAHHNKKKDSPSGTAMKLAEIIADNVNRDLKDCAVYGREGIVGERKKEEIGILAMRAGDIVGEHTVYFVGPGERIELTHRAHSRETFANGAVNAAVWLKTKKSGIYTMSQALGLE